VYFLCLEINWVVCLGHIVASWLHLYMFLCVYVYMCDLTVSVLGLLSQAINNNNRGNMGMDLKMDNGGMGHRGMGNGSPNEGMGNSGQQNGNSNGGIDFAAIMKNMGDFSRVFGNLAANMGNGKMGMGNGGTGNMAMDVEGQNRMAGGASNHHNQSGS